MSKDAEKSGPNTVSPYFLTSGDDESGGDRKQATLFTPYKIAGVELKNRIVISPMSQYRSRDGFTNDWHLPHLARFATGGAGLVFTEATGVEDRGRRTAGDLGLWKDEQIAGLKHIVDVIHEHGSIAGIQLGHAGRKASERRPWHGQTPIDEEDVKLRDEHPWDTLAPTTQPFKDGWHVPKAMDEADIKQVVQAFKDATRRARECGFKVIELYGAHGFLLHQFLSPVCNTRDDAYGGPIEKRMRFALEVIDAVRSEWPSDLGLSYRMSVVDWADGGNQIEDTVAFAKVAKEHGVDIIDCSTGGIGGVGVNLQRIPLGPRYQAHFAQAIREQAQVPTIAVGMIRTGQEAEETLNEGQADLIAVAREVLANPNWPLMAAQELGIDDDFALWPPEYGWWLRGRSKILRKLDAQKTQAAE